MEKSDNRSSTDKTICHIFFPRCTYKRSCNFAVNMNQSQANQWQQTPSVNSNFARKTGDLKNTKITYDCSLRELKEKIVYAKQLEIADIFSIFNRQAGRWVESDGKPFMQWQLIKWKTVSVCVLQGKKRSWKRFARKPSHSEQKCQKFNEATAFGSEEKMENN